MVKVIKTWKTDFYKNNDDNGGAMKQAIDNCNKNNIVIHSQTVKHGRIWGSVKPEYFLDLIKSNKGLYEVITCFPHKVYFDIDKKGTVENNYLENIKNIILQFFPNAQMAISGSIKETKTSYHIVLQNYTIHNEEERTYVKHLVKYLCTKYDDSFDWKVYTKNRNMKAINQSKIDGRVQEIIENDNFKDHCITCFINDYSNKFIDLPEQVEDEIMVVKSSNTFDLGELPKLNLQIPSSFDVINATPKEILEVLPLNPSFNFNYAHLVSRFCFYNDLNFETFLVWVKQKHNDVSLNEIVTKWKTHWNKLNNFPPVSQERICSILKYYYPHINKDIHYRKFADTFLLPTENIEKIETMNQLCFNKEDKKYFIFNVGMGGGKTCQTISYLKDKHSFLWIAPNKALASNTHKRFENENIDICHYESITTKDKKIGKMKEEHKLICCLNSIHYITDKQYHILIIDEIETLIDKFIGDFLEGDNQVKKQIWINFVSLFKNAKQVLLLDAFITTKTIKLIQNIEQTLTTTVIYERIKEPQTRTIHYINDEKTMLQDIINKLNEGNKLFIFYPYKKSSYRCKSMEEIYEVLQHTTGKKGIFYNAAIDDKVKKGLKDVNTSWKNQDFILTNNIITCGVNYDEMDFDYKYIFVASHNTPRDIIQVSYRARFLSSGIIKICYMGKMNQSTTWLNDCKRMECPIYSKMYDEILVEKKAPLKRALQLFCVKAHYKQKSDKYKINSIVEKELTKIMDKYNVAKSYETIENIDQSQAEHIEEACFCQTATMSMKYALNKYHFKKSFIDTTDEKILAQIWNDNYLFFFKRLKTILNDENHLFNIIARNNKFNGLFPNDIKKIKLTDKIKDDIFTIFCFKYISKISFTTKICKEIYNTYFGKNIISISYCDEDKHNQKYEVDEKINMFYEFAKSNLKLDTLTSMTFNDINNDYENSVEV